MLAGRCNHFFAYYNDTNCPNVHKVGVKLFLSRENRCFLAVQNDIYLDSWIKNKNNHESDIVPATILNYRGQTQDQMTGNLKSVIK